MACLTVSSSSILRVSSHRSLKAPPNLVLKGTVTFKTEEEVEDWKLHLVGNWVRLHKRDPNSARKQKTAGESFFLF
jgi:hypothetical protein